MQDLQKTKLVEKNDIVGASINYEPYVYPVQFLDYKNEIFNIKSFIF
jgi:hypothetical protein